MTQQRQFFYSMNNNNASRIWRKGRLVVGLHEPNNTDACFTGLDQYKNIKQILKLHKDILVTMRLLLRTMDGVIHTSYSPPLWWWHRCAHSLYVWFPAFPWWFSRTYKFHEQFNMGRLCTFLYCVDCHTTFVYVFSLPDGFQMNFLLKNCSSSFPGAIL